MNEQLESSNEDVNMESNESFDQWVILELMGHRRMGGRVTEQVIAGSALIRIDVYEGDAKEPTMTQFYSTSAVYCMTPVSENVARRFSERHMIPPISEYELPQLENKENEFFQ